MASGWYGDKITVASTADLAVTQLERIFITGNTSNHTLKIVDAATGSDIPGSSVTWTTASGVNGQFKYMTLGRPVTLTAGHSYYLVSQEVKGGDQWYGQTTTVTGWTVNSGWTVQTDAQAWRCYFQGGRYETGTNLYSFRNRDYSAALGRWVEVDPLGHVESQYFVTGS